MARWITGLFVAALLVLGLLALGRPEGQREPVVPPPPTPAAPTVLPAAERLTALAPRFVAIRHSTSDGGLAEGLARALGKDVLVTLGDPLEAAAAVRGALQDERPEMRWVALLLVGFHGPADDALLRTLDEALAPGAPTWLRQAAALAVPYVEAPAWGPLLDTLATAARDDDVELRRRAMRALAEGLREREEPLALLLEGLTDPDGVVREGAVHGLAQVEWAERLGPDARRGIVEALLPALADEREGVALYAAMALGRTGEAMAPAIPALIEALGDERALLRGNAASALSQGGDAAREALAAALADDRGERADMLTWALRLMGEEAVPILREATARPIARVAVHAALRLWEVDHDDAAAVERLVAHLGSDDDLALLQAVRGLGRIGSAARSALPALAGVEARLDAFPENRDLLERALAGTRAQLGP